MILYILLSVTVGFEGGMFELKGNDVVSPEFGPTYGVFCDFYVTPNLNYCLSFEKGSAVASTRTMAFTYDSLGQRHFFSEVRGEDYEHFSGNMSVSWVPIRTMLSPYFSGRLGFKSWRFVSGGDVVMSLNGNKFKGLSVALGGGAGLRGEVAGFVLSVEAFSDFIFSENSDWINGFGSGDDNEWIVEYEFRLGRNF